MASQQQHFAHCPHRLARRVEADLGAAMGRPQKTQVTVCPLCLLSTWKTSYVAGVWTMDTTLAPFIDPDDPCREETCSYCVNVVMNINVEKVSILSMTHRPNQDRDGTLLGQANRALWDTTGHASHGL